MSHAPGVSGWFTKYAVVRVFCEGETVVAQEDLPLKNCSFSWGVGGEVVCTLLTWIADTQISIGLYRGKNHLWLCFKVVI